MNGVPNYPAKQRDTTGFEIYQAKFKCCKITSFNDSDSDSSENIWCRLYLSVSGWGCFSLRSCQQLTHLSCFALCIYAAGPSSPATSPTRGCSGRQDPTTSTLLCCSPCYFCASFRSVTPSSGYSLLSAVVRSGKTSFQSIVLSVSLVS